MPTARAKKVKEKRFGSKNDLPGVALEKTVAELQKMMEPGAIVTRNEKLKDRLGIIRECDVVIRGTYAGTAILGIVECKDRSRKMGLGEIEAFKTKAEHLGANIRVMVSKKGFTASALKLATHENIKCLSVPPEEGARNGFQICLPIFATVGMWTDFQIRCYLVSTESPEPAIGRDPFQNIMSIKYGGKPVLNWFVSQYYTTYADVEQSGRYALQIAFNESTDIEIEGKNWAM
ncbi:MAG TPA: restriction endonuclease, partial [Methylobacter sp.]